MHGHGEWERGGGSGERMKGKTTERNLQVWENAEQENRGIIKSIPMRQGATGLIKKSKVSEETYSELDGESNIKDRGEGLGPGGRGCGGLVHMCID